MVILSITATIQSTKKKKQQQKNQHLPCIMLQTMLFEYWQNLRNDDLKSIKKNLKQNVPQDTGAESTHKGVNQCLKDVTQAHQQIQHV